MAANRRVLCDERCLSKSCLSDNDAVEQVASPGFLLCYFDQASKRQVAHPEPGLLGQSLQHHDSGLAGSPRLEQVLQFEANDGRNEDLPLLQQSANVRW